MKGIIHPGAHLVTPYQQGQLDSLCGLYALTNAIRVIYAPLHPLSGNASRSLFAAATKHLLSSTKTSVALHDGMTARGQHRLMRALRSAPILAHRPPLSLQVQKPTLKSDADFEFFVANTVKSGAVLLVCLEGRVSHHTTIVGVAAQRRAIAESW